MGIWAFDPGKTSLADCDDSGLVVGSLGLFLARSGRLNDLNTNVLTSLHADRSWLLGMQDRSGGWADFVQGLTDKSAGTIMTEPALFSSSRRWIERFKSFSNPPLALGGPPSEDVTASVLFGLGQIGDRIDSAHVQRAVQFLKQQQCESGAWWSQFIVSYVAATSHVISALANVRANLDEPWVQCRIEWLISHQIDDGG